MSFKYRPSATYRWGATYAENPDSNPVDAVQQPWRWEWYKTKKEATHRVRESNAESQFVVKYDRRR